MTFSKKKINEYLKKIKTFSTALQVRFRKHISESLATVLKAFDSQNLITFSYYSALPFNWIPFLGERYSCGAMRAMDDDMEFTLFFLERPNGTHHILQFLEDMTRPSFGYEGIFGFGFEGIISCLISCIIGCLVSFLIANLLMSVPSSFLQIFGDSPVRWQTGFQEPSVPTMEGIVTFHHHVMIVILFIVIFVGWILLNLINYYNNYSVAQNANFTHSNELEIVWTSVPALILVFLATPSFTLLYSMDELIDPIINFKIIGHQWYWSYELSDYAFCGTRSDDNNFKYDCYLLVLDSLESRKSGYYRLLETNKRLLFPTETHLRLFVSAADVLHSWTVPSFGIKVDACPGRLNLVNLFLNRVGLFFGQCSEICGVNHGFMPISVLVLDITQFNSYVISKLDF